MKYRVVFDVLSQGLFLWVAPALTMVPASLIAYDLFIRKKPEPGPWISRDFQVFLQYLVILVFTTLGLAVLVGRTWTFARMVMALRTGHAQVVEGPVTDYRLDWQTKGVEHINSREHFCVRDQCFDYTDDDLGAVGFHTTADNNGPIMRNLPVRVSSVDGVIVRIEVAQ